MHPFEVVFLKASWHVGVPFNDKYAGWQTKKLKGQSTTTGEFFEPMYRYAITCASILFLYLLCRKMYSTNLKILHFLVQFRTAVCTSLACSFFLNNELAFFPAFEIQLAHVNIQMFLFLLGDGSVTSLTCMQT